MIMLAEKQYEPVPGLPDFVLPAYYAIKAAEAAANETPDGLDVTEEGNFNLITKNRRKCGFVGDVKL